MINRLQRVQNTTAGYVNGRYAKMFDVINLNWLLIEKTIEINTVKLAHKSPNSELWLKYLKLASIERTRNLRSSDLGPIIKQGDDYTFQQQVTVYKNLPKYFKEVNDFKVFSRKIKGGSCQSLEFVFSLELTFAFMFNYAIVACYCNLSFSSFNFDSVLYPSF